MKEGAGAGEVLGGRTRTASLTHSHSQPSRGCRCRRQSLGTMKLRVTGTIVFCVLQSSIAFIAHLNRPFLSPFRHRTIQQSTSNLSTETTTALSQQLPTEKLSVPMSSTTKDKLKRLASRQSEWRSLGRDRKLAFLEQMLQTLTSNTELLKTMGRRAASSECMKYDLSTEEGQCEASMQYFLLGILVQQHLVHLIASYKVVLGLEKAPKDLVVTRKENGQVAVKVFPILPSEKMGPNSKGSAELYVDRTKVTSEDQVQLFALDAMQEPAGDSKDGALIVLGAGNQGFLTIADVLQGLFVNNRVVLVKHHPIREYQDEFIRLLFEPLMTAGFMDCESDKDFDKSSLYLEDLVAGVHMTGGKVTHDAIVWGSDKESRVAKNEPLLKCPMTSELGCVTPWIMTPFAYTPKELESQVLALGAAVSNNDSCNCNAPKVVIISEDWEQRHEFVTQLTKFFDERTVPASYYPGAPQRWEQFQKQYPDAVCLGKGRDAKKRQLDCPALPWLLIHLELDLSTEEGWKQAQSEYALTNEPFAPVLTILTIRGANDSFLDKSTKLCNEVMFGSLSSCMSVPQARMSDPKVEACIQELKYGSVAINAWSATCYGTTGCTWGAYPGESLDNVESGIGQVHNFWFIPHAQKCVLRMPCLSSTNDLYKTEDFAKQAVFFERIGDLLLNPGPGTILRFLASQVDLGKVLTAGGAALAIALGAVLFRKGGLV